MALKSLITGLFSKLLFLPSVFLVGCLFFISPVKSQIQAGLDAGHPTTILVNTDSIYMQNQSYGWFIFSTHNINNVSGNLFNLKAAFIPTSSRIIQYDTVTIRVVNLYDSTLNLIASDTLHSNDTLEFAANVNTNSWYYIQTVANYPCNTCTYNEAVTYNMQILAPIPTPTLTPFCICQNPSNYLSGILTSSPPPNQSYCINSDIYIYSNISFIGSEFKIKPGVKIVIGNGGNLFIDNCHLYSCSGMWKGIIVYDPATNGPSNGGISIGNNSLIEDANAAISYPYGNLNIFSFVINVSQTIFNRNDTAIVIKNYSHTTFTPYNFIINSCIFTSRRIPYNTSPPFVPPMAYYNNVKAIASNPGAPYTSPYFSNANYPFLLTKLGNIANIGIYLGNVGTIVSTPLSIYEIEIGSLPAGSPPVSSINIFDNLQYGIYAINSNFTCKNNVFQNGNTNSSGQVGMGIYAEALKVSNNRLRVIPAFYKPSVNGINSFYDLSRAILAKNYLFLDIHYCDIISSQINPLPTTPTPFHKGEYGVLISSTRFYQNRILNNNITNCENGIVFNAGFGPINIPGVTPGTVFNAQFSGTIRIDSNYIQPNIPSTPLTTQYVSNGIYLANTLPYGTLYQPSSLSISTNSNTIKNAYRGIYIANFQNNKIVTTNKNCISLIIEPNSTPNPIQYGIKRVNMHGPFNLANQIISNAITGPGTMNPNLTGIHIFSSVFENVRCNDVSNTGNSITFERCPQTCRFIGNQMFNYINGFSLLWSTIGQQGSLGNPSDNAWGPANCLTSFKTRVTGISSIFSPLYIRMAPPNFNPNGCCIGGGGTCYNIPTSLIVTNGPPYFICPTNVFYPTCGSGIPTPIALPTPSIPPFPVTSTLSAIQLLEKAALQQIPLSNVEQWRQNNVIFKSFKFNTPELSTSPILNNFYSSNINSVYSDILDIETNLFNENVTASQAKISSLIPQNTLEQNYKLYYQIYLNLINNQVLTSNDSIILFNLANSCPELNGESVFLARALFNAYYQKIIIWNDNCNNSSNQRTTGFSNNSFQSSVLNKPSEFLIYPNPAKDEITILSTSNCNISSIIIYDITGKTHFYREFNGTSCPVHLKLNLESGFYLIDLITTDNKHYTQKIIIE
jgi:hypothetical protein